MNKTFLMLGNKICFGCEWIKIKADKLWDKLVDLYEWIYEELYKPIYDTYRATINALINYKYWWKIIGKDRNFDKHYIFIMLRHKLIDDEKFYRSEYAWGVGASKLADKMKICILLLDRIIEDNYHENAFRNHDKKWGEIEMWSTEYDCPPDFHELNLNRTKVCNTDDYEQERKESRRLYKHVRYMEQQDIDYLFKIISKHIQGWWD